MRGICCFSQIPEQLYSLIHDFLTHEDYICLMNSSKSLFKDVKRQTVYFALDHDRSNQYCSDPIFRELLLSKVANAKKQISICDYQDSPLQIEILSRFPVHQVTLDQSYPSLGLHHFLQCEKVTIYDNSLPVEIPEENLGNIKELVLTNKLTYTPRSFRNLHQLCLWNCSQFTDVRILAEIPDLTLQRCSNIKDFSCLGPKQLRLFVSDAPHLKDVVSFGNVKSLMLENCRNLEEIGSLKTVYDLTLIGCGLKDLTQLRGHSIHRLYLVSYHHGSKKDYEALSGINLVRLLDCNIDDVSMFANAKSVILGSCLEVKDIGPLKRVDQVILDNCLLIEDYSMLGGVSDLAIEYPSMDAVMPSKPTANNKKWKSILLSHVLVQSTSSYEFLKDYHQIRFQSFPYVSDLLSGNIRFSNLREIIIDDCLGLIRIGSAFENVHTVMIIQCSSLNDIGTLGQSNHTVSIMYCGGIRDFRSLAGAQVLTIIDCYGSGECEELRSVPRLRVMNLGIRYF